VGEHPPVQQISYCMIMSYTGGGGGESGRVGNPQRHIKLRRNVLLLLDFQLLFDFVSLCVFRAVLHPRWHKYGTRQNSP